jgi:hypothetical protein
VLPELSAGAKPKLAENVAEVVLDGLLAQLGTTKDARKIGKSLFPVHRKATISSSAASKV